ncbi:uncharacterized protein YdcH (DUF465 family) [Bradyrhizobium sp. S3.14.4]
MWLFFVVAWFVLLAAIAIVAQQAFGYDVANLPALFADLPMPQRLATGAIVTLGLALIGAPAWRLSRQDRRLNTLRDRLKKTREDVVVAHALQNHLDATVQHLIESDPREAVSALHDKLGETEQRALLQQGRNESTDMHDQLAEIRRRQQGVREMVGKVADQRRAVEPVFTEIRDRQNQLERSLLDLETDDRKNNLADRLKDVARDVSALLSRVNAVQDTFVTLSQYKEDLAKSHAELVPLRSSDAGINALIGELGLSHDRLAKSIDELETGGEAPLDTRVETLSKNKIEIAQRLARIDDSFNILKAIRLDFEELGQRQALLERSLADVETDPDGQDPRRPPERAERFRPPVAPAPRRVAGDAGDAERVQDGAVEVAGRPRSAEGAGVRHRGPDRGGRHHPRSSCENRRRDRGERRRHPRLTRRCPRQEQARGRRPPRPHL